jgi:class 3 adenylate cyclase
MVSLDVLSTTDDDDDATGQMSASSSSRNPALLSVQSGSYNSSRLESSASGGGGGGGGGGTRSLTRRSSQTVLAREMTYFEKQRVRQQCRDLTHEQVVELLITERASTMALQNELRAAQDEQRQLQRTVARILEKTRGMSSAVGAHDSTEDLASEMSENMFQEFWYAGDSTEARDDFAPQTDHERNMLTTLASYVPNMVVRRQMQSSQPIVCPATEKFRAALLFADISGFTPLTERMGKLGQEGVEKLTTHLNSYFGKLVGLVAKYGGDIVKYAGDAILAQWPTDHDMFAMCMMASQCALELQSELHNFPVPDGVLTLHSGVGCGELTGLYVGGVNNRVEYLIDGEPLKQVSACEKDAESGEVYISPAVYKFVKDRVRAREVKGKDNYLLEAVAKPIKIVALRKPLALLLDMQTNMAAFLPGAVLHQIKNSKTGKIKYLAELRSITTLFCNLSMEYRGVEDLGKMQDAVVAIQKQLDRFEGTLRQFIVDDKGCVLIAVWGLPPLSHENDPERAVEAALGMMTPLLDLGVRPSIGITTGRVFCGDVGCETRREYAVVGDVVNLSARLMAASKQGILCDQLTYSNASRTIEFHTLDPIMVKGKRDPIAIFRPVKKISAEQERMRRRQTQKLVDVARVAPLIGRDAECAVLQRHAEQLAKATAATPTSVLLLSGDAGIGKTRLAQELMTLCKAQPLLAGEAAEMDSYSSFHAWKDVLGGAVTKLVRGAGGTDALAQQFGAHADVLKMVFDELKIPDDPKTLAMSGQARAERLHRMMLELVVRLTKPGTLLLMDSAQWLDNASWALLANVCASTRGLLVCIVVRPSKAYPLDYYKIEKLATTTLVHVGELGDVDATAKLISHWSALKSVPREITEQIHKKAHGNPFVTQEMTVSLMQFVDVGDDGARALRQDEALAFIRESMPRTVQALITSKIDRLSANQQMILKFASVVGMSFAVEFLYPLLPGDQMTRQQVEADLQHLCSAGILKQTAPAPAPLAYAFVNSFVHDGVYNLMLFAQKRQLHARIAEKIKDEHGGTRSFYAVIATHAKKAEEHDLAYEYYVKAGSAASAAFQNDEAAAFLLEALQLVGKTSLKATLDHVALERKLGLAYAEHGKTVLAREHLAASLAMLGIELPSGEEKLKLKFKPAKDLEWAARREAVLALVALARIFYYDCAQSLLCYVVFVALKLSEPSKKAAASEKDKGFGGLEDEVWPVAILIDASARSKEFQTPQAYIDLCAASKKPGIRLPADVAVGMHHAAHGRWLEADVALRNAQQGAQALGARRVLEEALVHRANVQALQGGLVEATKIAAEALQSARARGDAQLERLSLSCAARTQALLAADAPECAVLLEELRVAMEATDSADVASRINYEALQAWSRARSAATMLSAWEHVLRCVELIEKADPISYMTLFGYQAVPEVVLRFIVAARASDALLEQLQLTKPRLLALLDKSLLLLTKFADAVKIARPRLALWRALAAHVAGKKKETDKLLKDAFDSAVELQMLYEQALALHYRGLLLGAKDGGANYSQQAKDIFKSIGVVDFTFVDVLKLV